MVIYCPNIISGRGVSQVVVFELSASDGQYISSYQGSINQITFLLHALGFPHHRSQVLLYLPPVQLGLSESLAQHTSMGKASFYLFLIVATLRLPIFFHQSGSKVLMRSAHTDEQSLSSPCPIFSRVLYLSYLFECLCSLLLILAYNLCALLKNKSSESKFFSAIRCF